MIREIQSKTILIRNKYPQYWFGVCFSINVYRGCSFGCIYCDSRSRCYRINNFDQDIEIKVNAIECLKRELPRRKKTELIGFGAMSDPYIPLEKTYQMTRQVLELLYLYRMPLFLLTKSNLVLRDIDILQKMNKYNYVCVAFTITCATDMLSKQIEPRAPLSSERFKAMGVLATMGIHTGVVITPVLPFINDTQENLTSIIQQANTYGARFVYAYFGVTLRDQQRDFYYNHLHQDVVEKYKRRYGNRYMCSVPDQKLLESTHKHLCKKFNISSEMPIHFIQNTIKMDTLF